MFLNSKKFVGKATKYHKELKKLLKRLLKLREFDGEVTKIKGNLWSIKPLYLEDVTKNQICV